MESLFKLNTFIDFHTHTTRTEIAENCTEIVSYHFGQEITQRCFSIGKHPWFTKSTLSSEEKIAFIKIAKSEKCLGIGEIGLDKLKGENLKTQEVIFREMLSIAVIVNKPVILHCVKAFDELIKIKREFFDIKKWCIHGFYGHIQLAKQLINEGFYISLKPVNQITEKYIALVKFLPTDKFFIETDGKANTDIALLYLQVAKFREISVEVLQEQLAKNALLFFTHE